MGIKKMKKYHFSWESYGEYFEEIFKLKSISGVQYVYRYGIASKAARKWYTISPQDSLFQS